MLPPELAHAATERMGHIVLVLGAGCSMDHPTSLQSAASYSRTAHAQLVAQGVLSSADCSDHDDLGKLADAVFARHGTQAPLVQRLPWRKFRDATPNDGHKLAIALMAEGVISSVLTLNFDLALDHALADVPCPDVATLRSPSQANDLGSRNVVYLHRDANAPVEEWILRASVLEDAWRGGWQEVIAGALLAHAVVIFAGLGTPVEILMETTTRIRSAAPGSVFQVDPMPFNESKVAPRLNLTERQYVELGWVAFMKELSHHYLERRLSELSAGCAELCQQEGWAESPVPVLEELRWAGLIALGTITARWLMRQAPDYMSHEASAVPLIAEVILGVACIARETNRIPRLRADGSVELLGADGSIRVIGIGSGAGHRRWAAFETEWSRRPLSLAYRDQPSVVVAHGVVGGRPLTVSPPASITGQEDSGDLFAAVGPAIVSIDEIRADPTKLTNLMR